MRLTALPITSAATPAALAPFCELIAPPAQPGERAFYTSYLGSTSPAATPRLHVNHVPETQLPYAIMQLERHPHGAQIFLPLEAQSYLIVVAPALPDGSPDLSAALAFQAPGNVGVIYRQNVWHAGATSIGGKAHFAVHMWRNDVDDDVFIVLNEPLEVVI